MAKQVRVGVNGYGVIGKRVADAVRTQDDMELVGVADVVADYRIRTALALDIPVYASAAEKEKEMRDAGIGLAGTLSDLLRQVEVIVDATPKGIGAKNLPVYRRAGVKAIFQGGEKHELTGHSFVAQANYESALGRDATRVVSCNTTATVRTLGALRKAGLLKKARGVLIRRAADPWESHLEGIINTLVPEKHIPSHQAPDAKTVLPDLDVVTLAAKAPIDLSHAHFWIVELTRRASRDEVVSAFRGAPRIVFIHARHGLAALNSTLTLMSDLKRPRGDMWEVGLWEDILAVEGEELYYVYQVDNQAIVVPETIDAIRALSGIEREGQRSIEKTDLTLGVLNGFLPFFEEARAAENTADRRLEFDLGRK
jgi:glyceraldehyde-3-phosphate dehydrogenase (NAD(P))